MGELARFGVSLEADLLRQFDEVITKKGYDNRSEAIRDLIRDRLVGEQADRNSIVVGTLTIVYEHHRPNLTEKLIEAQHRAGQQSPRRHARALGPSPLSGSRRLEGAQRRGTRAGRWNPESSRG